MSDSIAEYFAVKSYAFKCIHNINKKTGADIPVVEIIKILWKKLNAEQGFKMVEEVLV